MCPKSVHFLLLQSQRPSQATIVSWLNGCSHLRAETLCCSWRLLLHPALRGSFKAQSESHHSPADNLPWFSIIPRIKSKSSLALPDVVASSCTVSPLPTDSSHTDSFQCLVVTEPQGLCTCSLQRTTPPAQCHVTGSSVLCRPHIRYHLLSEAVPKCSL